MSQNMETIYDANGIRIVRFTDHRSPKCVATGNGGSLVDLIRNFEKAVNELSGGASTNAESNRDNPPAT